MKVAVLDDCQNVVLQFADWSGVRRHIEITAFKDNDETDGETRQHIAWSDRRRCGSDRSAAGVPDSRSRGRRIRGRWVWITLPEAGERPRDASHRLRNRRSLSYLLRPASQNGSRLTQRPYRHLRRANLLINTRSKNHEREQPRKDRSE